MPEQPEPARPLGELIGAGTATGGLAGLMIGAIDALWSWTPARQFLPGFASRLRFVGFTATSYLLAGLVAGLAISIVALGLWRATRIGTLLRFAVRTHDHQRAHSPETAVIGLALVLAGIPTLAASLLVAFRLTVPYISNRHVIALEVVVAMAATLGAIVAAIPIAFIVASLVELGLVPLARRFRAISSPFAPFVALGAMLGLAVAIWANRDWETARQLPLRQPLVVFATLAAAILTLRPAIALAHALGRLAAWRRITAWLILPVLALWLVLATGGSAAVIKAAAAYTGLGGPIAHTLRRAFDRDHDGYARYLGGGDCDDSDPNVHPGAPEIPDDGIDQNCVGGDATTQPTDTNSQAFVPPPPGLPPEFNVLVITIDTTRADHLGMYGYPRATSPNLDAMAKTGIVFDHGWAHAPSTRYSMPAILTGRLPLDVHYDTSVEGWPGLAPQATTLAEVLAPLGFVTGAITNYWYFDRSRHMDQGFAEYDNEDARLHTTVAGAGPEQTHGSSSPQQTDKAIAFVGRHAQQRWMLWVHYYDPHYAYEPHPELPSFGSDRMALYDGELAFTDHHIGRLFDELKAKGLYDKTVIVVTGDHGEGFGEHGVELHGYHLYAAQTKVPLIIRVPGLPPRHASTPAGHVDILPTLVDLAGGQPTAEMMGRSLVDVLAGAELADRTVFQQLSYENNHEMRAGVSDRCHVIYNVSPDPSWEVYRIDTDPMETHDLATDDDACASTRRAVERWYDRAQVPAGAVEALLPARPAIAAPLDLDFDLDSAIGADPPVRLLAVEAPPRVKPGESIPLTWTFEARGPVAAGWKMFVHVEGPNRVFLNGDHRPARPFEWWRAGQFIRYTTNVVVPRTAAPGHYTVHAGMFSAHGRAKARAPRAKIADDAADVIELEVAP